MNLPSVIQIYRGNSWEPDVFFTIKDAAGNDTPLDCTSFDSVLILKPGSKKENVPIMKHPILWTDSAKGEGKIVILPGQSKEMQLGSYDWELLLFHPDTSFSRTCGKGILNILPSLDSTPWQ